jgi:serine/threonine-protein kinase
MALTPGALIAGRYRVDRRIGAGGMSEVWIGEHVAVGVKVALKTLLPAIAEDHEILARFKREAYLLGRIRSDYIVRVIDFITENTEDLVLVMEFVEGDPLDKVLQTRKLTIEDAIEIGIDVSTALTDLHRARIVHRDLKPGNIILRPRGDGRARAVIVDFGISRLVQEEGAEEQTMTGITKVNTAIGTVEYMAPEQLLNSRDVTGVSDLYALGAMLFRAVAGHHVFGDLREHRLAQAKLIKDPPRLDPGRDDAVAQGFVNALAKLIARRPAERYQRAEDVLADLLPLRELASGTGRAPVDLNATVALGFDVVPAGPTEATVKPREPSSPSARMAAARQEPSNRSGPHPAPDARAAMASYPDARAAMASQHDGRPPMGSQHDARAAMASYPDARPPMESIGAGAPPSPAMPNAFAAPVVPAQPATGAPAPKRKSVAAVVVPAVLFALVGGVGIGVVMWKALAPPPAPAASVKPDVPAPRPSASAAASASPSAAAPATASASAAAPAEARAAPSASGLPAAASASAAPAASGAPAVPGATPAAPSAAPSAAPAASGAALPAAKPGGGGHAKPHSEPVEVAPTAKGPAPDVGNVGF